MKKKRVAIIGGAGFIGHNLSVKLSKVGYEVCLLDSLSVNNLLSFNKSIIQNRNLYFKILNERFDLIDVHKIKLEIVDARDYHALSKALNNFKPNKIVHLAAVSHANLSNKDPHNTFDHSLRTLENALDYSRSINSAVDQFVYFSSSMVYGNFKTKSVNETTQCDPVGIYGNLKYSGELIVKAYNQVFDLPYTIVRPSALYGERCVSGRVGQIFIEKAVQNLPIQISGSGNSKLDFTYIEDLIEGVKLILSKKKACNEIFNITYGSSRKISDLAKILKKSFSEIKIEYIPKDKLTPDRGTLSINKAKKLIGYKPNYPIERGYTMYIDWYRNLWRNS